MGKIEIFIKVISLYIVHVKTLCRCVCEREGGGSKMLLCINCLVLFFHEFVYVYLSSFVLFVYLFVFGDWGRGDSNVDYYIVGIEYSW